MAQPQKPYLETCNGDSICDGDDDVKVFDDMKPFLIKLVNPHLDFHAHPQQPFLHKKPSKQEA